MKTKLLKLALCAMAALPMGAWADVELMSYTFTDKDVSSYGTDASLEEGWKNSMGTATGGAVSLYWKSGQGYCHSVNGSNAYRFISTNATPSIKLELSSGTFQAGDVVSVTFNCGSNDKATGYYVRAGHGTTENQLVSGTTTGSTYVTKTVTLDANFTSNTIFIDHNQVSTLNARSITVTRPAYNVNHNLTGVTATSGDTGDNAAVKGADYSAVFAANDGFVLPSTIGVTIGDEAKTVDKDYTWDSSTGTVTIPAANVTGDIVITVTATKAAVVTKWNFEQFVSGYNLFGSASGCKVMEYADGLYLHTRDADSDNHWVKTATATISSSMDEDITTQTQTYERGKSYTGILINTGNVTVSADDETANVSCNGFSYKVPAAGKLYYTFYTTSRTHIYTYKNAASSPTDDTIDPTSKGGIGKEYSLAVSSGDVVYVTTSGTKGTIYLLDVLFVPTAPESTHTTVTFKSAGGGYASFSSTKNYKVPTGVTAYYVSSVDDMKNKAVMATISAGSVIPACTGVILYKDGVTTEDVAVKMTTAGETNAVDNQLRANIVAYDLPASGDGKYNYTLAYESSAPVFKHSSGSGTLAAGKAFLRTTVVGGSARGLDLVFDEGETTGISAALMNNERMNNEVFNLAGQRVAQPTRGLYIVNGKKVIIK